MRVPSVRVGGRPGEGEEDVVQVGRVHVSCVDLDAARSSWSSRPAATLTLPSVGTCRVSSSSSRGWRRRARRPRLEADGVGEAQAMWPPGTRRFSSSGGALGDEPAVVEHGDPVGELVGLVQVLRGQEDRSRRRRRGRGRSATSSARLRGSRPVVGSSRKTIRGSPTSAHRQVEPAAHAAGVGRPAVLRGGVGEVELLEQLVDPPAALGRPRWCRSAISSRFSRPVSRPSTAENWPVTPIAARTASGSAATSWPATRTSPASARDQGREDVHDGGLAGAVRAEQREDGALRGPSGRCRRARRGRRRTCAGRRGDRGVGGDGHGNLLEGQGGG